jgi:drug/metabolite transporter (DMT)-like permease
MLSRHAFYILAAAASASCCVILQKNYLRKYPAIDLTAYITIAAALQLLPFTIGLREEIASAPRVATLAVIYLGIIPAALAYSLWAFVLSHWPASRTVSFLYLAPALTCIISWFWLSEIPSNVSILGGIIALSGVVLVNTKGK